MNRATDVDLPNRLWDPWIEMGKPRMLRRPLTDAERKMLVQRRDEIAPWIGGYAPPEADRAAEAISMMFAGFRTASQSDEQAVATVDGLLRLLAPYPAWAIVRACNRIRAGGYFRGNALERHWPPSDSVVFDAVDRETRLIKDQHDSAVALLNAKSAITSTEGHSR